MKKMMMLAVAAMVTILNVNAQLNDETQGVGGLVLDSLWQTNSEGVRKVKFVYEYNEDKQPTKKTELVYFDDDHTYLADPVVYGYETYVYDSQKRLKRNETYEKENGVFRANYVTEIAEYDESTSLPSLIYTYEAKQGDPNATLELQQKAEVTKYYGNKDIAEMNVFLMQDGSWQLMATVRRDFNGQGLMVKETSEIGGFQLVTEYEYDDHGHLTQQVVKQVMQFMGQDIEEVTSKRNFTNAYYDDGNLKSVIEENDGQLIETSHYFWGDGSGAGIQHIINVEAIGNKWIDLNGRILNGKPGQKGVYIKDGRKVLYSE